MKLHDLRPPKGSNTPRTRVGRGIAANKGKTAGRGTKGQKSRTGSSIPGWFEGGQTPIHIRIPKLRGFRNRAKVDYEVVNLGRISELVGLGELEPGSMPDANGPARAASKAAPITVNQEILRAVGLVSTLKKPLKILGHGHVTVPLFVVADAFSKSAIAKIQAAGGSVQALEVPATPRAAILGEPRDAATPPSEATAAPHATEKASPVSQADSRPDREPAAAAKHSPHPAGQVDDEGPRKRAAAPGSGPAAPAAGPKAAGSTKPKASSAAPAAGAAPSGAKPKRSPDASATKPDAPRRPRRGSADDSGPESGGAA